MALIDHIDGPHRDIYLSADTVGAEVNPMDIYREVRSLRASNEDLQRHSMFISAFGNIPKGGGKATERFTRLNDGARIVPFDITHGLTITGTIITDDGQEGIACFDRTPLSASTVVDINYVPPQVEIITVATGSGVTSSDITEIADAVWNKLLVDMVTAGTAGEKMNAMLTVNKYLALQK